MTFQVFHDLYKPCQNYSKSSHLPSSPSPPQQESNILHGRCQLHTLPTVPWKDSWWARSKTSVCIELLLRTQKFSFSLLNILDLFATGLHDESYYLTSLVEAVVYLECILPAVVPIPLAFQVAALGIPFLGTRWQSSMKCTI